MPAIESRPYRVPGQQSVTASVQALSPDVALDEIPDHWEPGHDLVFRITATLSPAFWQETEIDQNEDLTLTGTITCLAARTRWRAAAVFRSREEDHWTANVDIAVDGSAVAVELLIDVAVVGPGRTGHPDPVRAIHRAARLWGLPAAVRAPLEKLGDVFPTSAVSFSTTGRRRVPWSVDISHDAEPHWGLSSAIRLYINTDLTVGEDILEGSAHPSAYQAIQADILSAALLHLATVREGYSMAVISESIENDVSSFAAFCAHVAAKLGFDLEVALRLAREEPMQLVERAREASGYMIEEG